jgi:hypothetical protein
VETSRESISAHVQILHMYSMHTHTHLVASSVHSLVISRIKSCKWGLDQIIYDWLAPASLGKITEVFTLFGNHQKNECTHMHICVTGWAGGSVAHTSQFVGTNKAKRCGGNKSPMCVPMEGWVGSSLYTPQLCGLQCPFRAGRLLRQGRRPVDASGVVLG